MTYIKLPNKLFSLDLSPLDILVFAGLKYLDKNNDNSVITRARDIAEICGIHRNSVAKAIKALEECKAIKKVNRYSQKGYRASNRYYLAGVSRKYFLLPATIFSYGLSPSAFAVFCYLLRCANRSGRAYPSLRKIAAHTGLCVDTVTAALNVLVTRRLLDKQRYITIECDYGCNNYKTPCKLLLRIKGWIKKKVARLLAIGRTTNQNIYKVMILRKCRDVKRYFMNLSVGRCRLLFFRLGVLEKMCNLY